MTPQKQSRETTPSGTDFTTLPVSPRLEDTVTSVDADAHPAPEDVRNTDQHQALRDD